MSLSSLSPCASGRVQAPTALELELIDAARQGKRSIVLKLLQRDGSRVQDGLDKALQAAAECGRSEVVKLLIDYGAALDARGDGGTPLHLAASKGHVEAAAALLDAQADINSTDSHDRTPLHVARDAAMVQLLLDAGADVSAKDLDDLTPLHHASMWCVDEPVSLLLAAGADITATCLAGKAALHYACEHRNSAAVRVLLAAGASIDAVDGSGCTPLCAACGAGDEADTRVLDALISSGAQLTIPNDLLQLPLHVAVGQGRVKTATCLLQANPAPEHVNAAGPLGSTPLQLAASKGDGRMTSLLLAAGADVAAMDVDGITPLHGAVAGKHLPVVKQLLAAGADPGAAGDDAVLPPLHVAACEGYTAILQALLAAMAAAAGGGGGVDAAVGGMTALHFAAEHGHISCVRLLLAAGADASRPYGAEGAFGLDGASVLHRMVQLKRAAMVPLLSTPANMRCVWEGNTPLHLALAAGCAPSMAQALVAAGSPVGLPNADGATAMSLAAGSTNAAHRALLPAMVRRECERYKQLQHGRQQQQQHQDQDGAAILTAVVDAVSALLEECAAPASSKNTDICMSCIEGMMKALGGAAASRLMEQVLAKCMTADAAAGAAAAAPGGVAAADNAAVAPAAAAGKCSVRLVKALSKGCFAALEPLMQQRWQLTNRLQHLVTAPCEQALGVAQPQKKRRRGRQEADPAATAEGAQQAVTDTQLSARAMAAAQDEDWQRFVQL